jgi:hypothetical protein
VIEQVLKFPKWQEPLQQLILNFNAPGFSERAQQMHQSLQSRLHTMTTADMVERQALEDALHTIDVLAA